MNTFLVVIMLELDELLFEIHRVPEENMIKKFAANGSYQTLNKWMRYRNIGDCFNFVNVKDA